MSDHLFLVANGFGIHLHAFVLMSNHFHLLATSPNGNLSEAMLYFMRETSRWLTRKSGRINQAWGGRFSRTEIDSYHYFLNAYKYLYRNPVQAGIVDRVEDYPFSSLQGLLGQRPLHFPLQEDTLLFHDIEGTIDWLNKAPSSENLDAIRKGMRRQVFTLPKKDSRPHPLEIDLL